MYLDLHGNTQSDGIFFQACQPAIPKSVKGGQVDDQILERFILLQALPATTAKLSEFFDKKKNKFFSFQQDRAGNKLSTGRVVGLRELGIDLCYTVKTSFWL